ncbi:lantibiotic dehydratase C-terminal domain-containing protein [Kitasatospora phosalacinea]|uniref:lantibiotic dehydratase C-terminal domain-containing protein n=1 Tax=Kitasatospora phosalacinea TaxID=2065 RepID=UPI00364AC84C
MRPATIAPATRQYLLRLATAAAEAYAVRHLGPALARLEDSGAIGAWYFERGADTWTLVCEGTTRPGFAAETPEREVLDLCSATGMITSWTATAYRPPTYSAGGEAGLPAALRWRHRDSRHVLTYLRTVRADQLEDQRGELFVLHSAAAMAAAGLDQRGVTDTWRRIAGTAPGALWPAIPDDLLPAATAPDPAAEPGHPAAWSSVHADYGRAVADLHRRGLLWGGPRAVLAAQLLTHADRLGVADPARLATAAATASLARTAPAQVLR